MQSSDRNTGGADKGTEEHLGEREDVATALRRFSGRPRADLGAAQVPK